MVQSRRDEGRSWGHHRWECGRIIANTAMDILGYWARLPGQKLWLTLYCTNFLFLNDVKCWKPGKKALSDQWPLYELFRAWSVRSGKGTAPAPAPAKGCGAQFGNLCMLQWLGCQDNSSQVSFSRCQSSKVWPWMVW